ncbi:MAG TPA: hypothetical protein PLY93_14840 [Turneriella sp.]|nr:hypothetical protein [Turneriella sp.]
MMRHFYSYIVSAVIVVTGLTLGCSCNSKAEENIPKADAQPALPLETITGTVQVYDHNGNKQVVLELKRDKRSKITYEITGKNTDAVSHQKGKKLTVTGFVRNLSPFHKLIDVQEIQ